jgi:hypothetical protein
VFIEFLIETESLYTIYVYLSDFIVTINDDFELPLTLILLFVFAVE